jgi:hypothetical protein
MDATRTYFGKSANKKLTSLYGGSKKNKEKKNFYVGANSSDTIE